MLHRTPFRFTVFIWSKWLFWAANVVNITAAALTKLPDRPQAGAIYREFYSFAQANCWWLVVGASGTIGLTSVFLKTIGSQETWETLHELLDSLHAAVFTGPGYAIPDEHKVTIFKAVKVCSHDRPFDYLTAPFRRNPRWLRPVVRSGHTSQDTNTCFRLYDDAGKCEGIAGQAWAQSRVVAVSDLPNVALKPYAYEIRSYAGRSFVSEDRVKEKKPKSRALLAMPILVKGVPWGVLVFDSRNPAKIRYEEVEEMYRVISKHLNTLITKHL